jgi:hypothetical protein
VKWLEYHEFLEVGASFTSAARQARSVIQDKINARDLAMEIRKAETFEQLNAIIEESAPTFRFAHMELRYGTSPRHLPAHIAGELHSTSFCKLEYPIPQRTMKRNQFVVLNVWCTTEPLPRPVSAERVARIISPAISTWMEMGHLAPAAAQGMTTTSVSPQAKSATSTSAAVERPHRHMRSGQGLEADRASGAPMAAKPASRGDEVRS